MRARGSEMRSRILLAAFIATGAVAGSTEAWSGVYSVTKGDKEQTPGKPPKPMVFKPNNQFGDYKATWVYTLKGIAEDSKTQADVLNVTSQAAPVVGQVGVPLGDKRNVDTAFAHGFMNAQASFQQVAPATYEALTSVDGFAYVDMKGAEKNDWAYAVASSSSTLSIFGQGQGGGKWTVKPIHNLSAKGCTSAESARPIPAAGRAVIKACKAGDPIDFTLTDLVTGEVLSGNLFTTELERSSFDGVLSLQDNLLDIQAASGRFYLNLPGVYTAQSGLVDFEFVNGVVTKSVTSGQFAGLLPGVGASAFGIYDLGDLSFDYDFGLGDHAYDVTFNAGVNGETSAWAVVPEPRAWSLMILGFGAIGAMFRSRCRPRGAPGLTAAS